MRSTFWNGLLVVSLALFATPSPAAASTQAERLVIAARTWGLAKYHHPRVTACALDWDQALMDAVPALDAAGDDAALSAALTALLAQAGPSQRRPLDASTPAWIANAPVTIELREELAWLAAERPVSQCYVRATPNTLQANFIDDNGHGVDTANRAHRFLGVFRAWNAIEWWFPYKPDIGRDWAKVLEQHAERVLDAPGNREYFVRMREFTAEIVDSHAALSSPEANVDYGSGWPRVLIRRVEGKYVVAQKQPSSVGLGDEIIAVDNLPFEFRRIRAARVAYGSNPVFRDQIINRIAMSGAPDPGKFRFRRLDGSEYEVQLDRIGTLFESALTGQPVWQTRNLGACTMGHIDLPRLERADVPAAMAAVINTDAIVFDMRGYPRGTIGLLMDYLSDTTAPWVTLTFPSLTQPGTFSSRSIFGISGPPSIYRKPILVLHDERAISQSEFSIMGLQGPGRAITFGSQTAAADGDVTSVSIPGRMSLTFTGLGVFYPDGRITQRVGMVPDVHVYPTRAGLAAGRDEVLEAALDCKWTSEAAPKRIPPDGLYFAPERTGEGLDVHRNANAVAVLSYGYDANGEPEWLFSSGAANDERFGSQFVRITSNGASTPVAGYSADFQRGPYSVACASADQNGLIPRSEWRWTTANGTSSACALPLLRGEGPRSGLWAATATSENGWGLSVHEAAGRTTVVVYAYDAGGNPRWLTGSADSSNGAMTIALERVRGFCRTCAASETTRVAAGTLTLDLEAKVLDVDAAFAADGARWVRTRMPIEKL